MLYLISRQENLGKVEYVYLKWNHYGRIYEQIEVHQWSHSHEYNLDLGLGMLAHQTALSDSDDL